MFEEETGESRMSKRNRILTIALLISLLLPSAGQIGAQGGRTAEDTLGGDATGVVYERKDSLNNGEPFTLEIWDWFTSRTLLWQQWAPLYEELYPNITVEITQVPGADYWTKIIAAIPAGEGPDIYAFHNSMAIQFIENDLMEPFPPELFDPDYYMQNYLGFREGYFSDDQGRIRFIPYGSMAALIYVNTDLWEAAGLTEADIPTSWDEMADLAVSLSQFDDNGNLEVAGWDFNGMLVVLWSDMMYQLGRYMWTADGQHCQIDNEDTRRILEYFNDLYDRGANSRDFLEANEAFHNNRTVMVYDWTWYSGNRRANAPDQRFFTFPLPTFTPPTDAGEYFPSYGRQNFDVSHVVSVNKPPERQEIAWDFMHWLHSQDEFLVEQAMSLNIPPYYIKLANDPAVLADDAIGMLAQVLPYTIFPGDWPDPFDQAMYQYMDNNFVGGTSIDDTIAQTQEACDMAVQEGAKWTVERDYRYGDMMQPGQP
jgi:multiple sugar transport system substrate-binding protein